MNVVATPLHHSCHGVTPNCGASQPSGHATEMGPRDDLEEGPKLSEQSLGDRIACTVRKIRVFLGHVMHLN